MTGIVFDIERCFVDGRSGPIALGVTRLDELAQAHAPTFDHRAHDENTGAPSIRYDGDVGLLAPFDLYRTGHVTAVNVDVSADQILGARLDNPEWGGCELECGPFLVRMNDKPVERWASLVNALASGAIERARPVELSTSANVEAGHINLERSMDDGRWLHLSFEPRLITMPRAHAAQVRFELCLARARIFASPPRPGRPRPGIGTRTKKPAAAVPGGLPLAR